MKRLWVFLAMGFFLFALTGDLHAVGTAAEAQGMVEKAAAFMKANGKEKAFQAFSDQKGQFVKDDLYIFVLDPKGMTLAHGGNPKLVGSNLMELKDPNGKFFIKDMIDGANAKGAGWSDYSWPNPVSKKVSAKSTYYLKVDNVIIGCGVYKN